MTLIFPEIPLWISISLLAFIAGIYTIAGGLAAAIYTDAVQAILLLLGSVIVTVLAVTPPEDLSLIRPLGDPNMPWLGLVTGVFLLGFYFWATNQFITQRVLSAKNLNHGRWGELSGIVSITFEFDCLGCGFILVKWEFSPASGSCKHSFNIFYNFAFITLIIFPTKFYRFTFVATFKFER
jgi:Na+/proline symporter